jgi:hypothetical protein
MRKALYKGFVAAAFRGGRFSKSQCKDAKAGMFRREKAEHDFPGE